MISEQPVPGLPGAVMRQVETLPDALPGAISLGVRSQATPGRLLVTHPGAGSFLASDGTLIEYTLDDGADLGAVNLILHGTARGALIHQRGELPLHAATLVAPGGDGSIAICGRSGAGKSTLAMELCRRGWLLVADDTTRVTWDGSVPLAWPSRDSIKLWKDACETANIATDTLLPVMRDMEKYYVHVPSRNQPIRLDTIIELTRDGATAELSIGDRMALITRHTYRPSQIRALGVQKSHVGIVARIAVACRMFQLPGDRSRPVGVLADAVAAAIV